MTQAACSVTALGYSNTMVPTVSIRRLSPWRSPGQVAGSLGARYAGQSGCCCLGERRSGALSARGLRRITEACSGARSCMVWLAGWRRSCAFGGHGPHWWRSSASPRLYAIGPGWVGPPAWADWMAGFNLRRARRDLAIGEDPAVDMCGCCGTEASGFRARARRHRRTAIPGMMGRQIDHPRPASAGAVAASSYPRALPQSRWRFALKPCAEGHRCSSPRYTTSRCRSRQAGSAS